MLKAYLAAKDKIVALKDRLVRDNSGAALIEYSILIGLITVAAIVAIITVGGWVANAWGNLQAALP